MAAGSMLGVVVSRADAASVHIGDRLRELADWTAVEDDAHPDSAGGGTVYRTAGAELRTFDDLHIHLAGPATPFEEVDLLVFASRHAGETGPMLTAHHTGNFGPAEYGGAPDRLPVAAPVALSAAIEALDAEAPSSYDVSLECTHHGPTDIDVPSLFVEVGSDDAAWEDPDAAAAAARAIHSLRGIDPHGERTVVGFGGGHYAPRFSRIVRETDWCVGHIAADWALSAMGDPDPALLRQAFTRSGARFAVLDGDWPGVAAQVDELGYRLVGESWLRTTAGVPLETVERFEATLRPIDDGLRFGRAARNDGRPSFEIVEPAAALLADANGVDPQRTRSAVDGEAIAYETVESGSRVAGRIAVPDVTAREGIEAALLDLLRERFDEVTVEGDEILAVERVFDPDRARALGVEPGPAFGRLADGEPVSVDGEPIPPEAVHVTTVRRYPRG